MIFWGCLVFSRDFGRPQGAKFKIYLIFEDCRGFRCGSHFVAVVVSTGAGCRASDVLRCVFRPFCPLSRFVLVVLLANVALFRVLRAFLAWFRWFVWVCVAWALCVACVAFVRVWS